MVTFNVISETSGRFSWTGAGSLNESYSQAVTLFHSGEKSRAIELLEQLHRQNPDYFYITEFLGSYYMETDQTFLAMDYFREVCLNAQMRIPEDFKGAVPWSCIENRAYLSALYNLGVMSFGMHNYEFACMYFRKLLELDPWDRHGVRYIMGDVYFNAGNIGEAEFSYRQCVKNSHVRYSLGLLLYAKGNHAESVQQFCSAIILDDIPYSIHTSCRLKRTGDFQKRVDAMYYTAYTADLWAKYGGGEFLKKIFESKTFQVRYHRIIMKRKQLNNIMLTSAVERMKLKREIFNLVNSISLKFAQQILNDIKAAG